MNITFKKVRWKNLLSTGDIFTEVDLNQHNTTLISGSNGSGKSTIIDAIVFALYGKPFRKINKPQLINSINQKEMIVELDFTIGKINYSIRRGIKPNVFEIYRNGILDNKAIDQQAELENNILKMNFKSFTQVVILGSATYIPFMELTAKDRREIIEDLLDIAIFSTMNNILKEKISHNKDRICDNKYRVELVKSKIEAATENAQSIKKIREDEIQKIKQKIQHHIETIEAHTSMIEQLNNQVFETTQLIIDKDSVAKKIQKIRDVKSSLDIKSKSIEKDLKFYQSHDNCPTCKQNIDNGFKQDILNEKHQQYEHIVSAFQQLSDKADELSKRISEISDIEQTLQKLHLKIGEHRVQIKISKTALNECKVDLDRAKAEIKTVDNSRLDEYNHELNVAYDEQRELLDEKETFDAVSVLLKDSGIKTKIVKQFIPVMNKLINRYLAEFDLFVDFHLDENFNEVIKSRFRDTFSYASFSEGEKLRINLAIMLTWRTIAKMRNSVSTNLLIMDETLDGALDSLGIETLIDTLHRMNNGDNIFVISHRGDQLQEKFTHHIRFVKQKNFSQMLLC